MYSDAGKVKYTVTCGDYRGNIVETMEDQCLMNNNNTTLTTEMQTKCYCNYYCTVLLEHVDVIITMHNLHKTQGQTQTLIYI